MAKADGEVWYLREWFATNQMKQRDLITKLDWLPAKAHKIWHGIQRPKLDEAAEVADLLQIEPYELLMAPEDAMRLRRLRAVLSEVPPPEPKAPEAAPEPTEVRRRAVSQR